MTSKEIGELRRRMRPDRTNMTAVRGCYVSASGEILSTFRESVALMSQEDKESYLSIFRRVPLPAPAAKRMHRGRISAACPGLPAGRRCGLLRLSHVIFLN